MVDSESAPAALVGAEDAADGAAGEGVIAAATVGSLGPLTAWPTALAAGLTPSCVDTGAAFPFDPPVELDDDAAFTAPAFAGAAAVAALATRAATNFAAAAFVFAAFSAAALRASAEPVFAEAAFLSATGALTAADLAAIGLALTALSTGLAAGLEAGFGADLAAVDLAFALATTVFVPDFSAVLPVWAVFLAVGLPTVAAVALPRAAAVAEAVRAAALRLEDFVVAAFAALPERAVERVALWLAALAAALTVRAGACAALRFVVAARAVDAALPLLAFAVPDERAVVRLTAACFAAFARSGFAPRLVDLALFLALFVDMRSTLLIASAAQAAGAEPKGQRRRTNQRSPASQWRHRIRLVPNRSG